MGRKLSKFEEAIDGTWNAGMRLSQAHKFLQRRGHVYEVRELIAQWRARKKEFGCACVKRYYPGSPTEEELKTLVGGSLYGNGTYGDWAGITGPGAQLRAILAAERAKGV